MKKNIILKILMSILSIIAILILMQTISNAASLNISTSKSSVSPGEKFSVTVSVNGGAGRADLSVSNGTLSSTEIDLMLQSSVTVTCTAGNSGNVNISASGIIADYITEQDESKFASETVTIVQPNPGGTSSGNSSNSGSNGSQFGSTGTTTTPTKSNNANLKNLGIRPNDFSGFSKNPSKENWSVTVPYDVEEIEVYAEKGHSEQTISGTGKKILKEGSNNLSVVVTAEDGTKKTYKINVVRNSEDEEMVPNVIDENIEEKPEALRLTALSLQDDLNLALSPIFNSEVFEYTLEVESDLEKLELSGIPNVNGAKVTIEGNDKLEEEENIITLTVKADGYEDVVYTIKVIKKANEEVALIAEEVVQEEPTPAELDNSIANKKIIIVVSVLVLIIISIIVILLLIRKKNNKKLYSSYYDYYNDYPNETEKLEALKETKQNTKAEEDIFGKSEITEGYTAEIENDIDYKETPRKKRGKGKHF